MNRKNEAINTVSDGTFVVAGFCSATITLAAGAFYLVILALCAGLIFSAALLVAEICVQRNLPLSGRTPRSRRLLAGLVVALSYPCCTMILAGTGALFGRLGINSRITFYVCGMIAAAIAASLAFYWALAIMGRVKSGTLLWLLVISLSAALVSVSSIAWGQRLLVLRPGWFVSPLWVTLLIIGETGFAWVWGRSHRADAEQGIA